MRRLPLIVALLGALIAVGPAGMAAQDATPGASDSALATLGYPELLIRVDGDTFDMPETTVAEGRILIRLENAGEESWHGFLLRQPEGVTDEQVTSDLGPEAEAPPAWLFEADFPGFPGETLPGQTNLAVVDLTPGRYLVLGDSVQPFAVAGAGATPAPAADVDADGTVRLSEYAFDFPEPAGPGQQIWAVANDGEEPHELLLARSSEPVTVDQVLELFADEFAGEGEAGEATPTGDTPPAPEIEPVGGMGWLSPGATAWTEVDLRPGTYVALCFVFDPATGMPHVALGMVDVLTVGEAAATPAA